MKRQVLAALVLLSVAGAAANPPAAARSLGDSPDALIFADGFESGDTGAWSGDPVSGSDTIATSDAQIHTYFYRVPGTPAPAAGRPALLWLHGDGGTGGGGFGSGFYPYTDPDGAIVVTPSGINQTWTHAAGDLPGMPQDSQFLSLLIAQLIAEGVAGEVVDPARIYLGGVSRGAYMPYFLLQRPSTKDKLAAVAVNAGLLYCQAGDADCATGGSSPLHHDAAAAILHLHGTNDTAVEPPPTALFHVPIDWNIDWRVFWPMNLWAGQHGCFGGDNSTGNDDGVLRATYLVGANTARVYDLTGWDPNCAKYQLILVTNGGHVIPGQEGRIWSFLASHLLGE